MMCIPTAMRTNLPTNMKKSSMIMMMPMIIGKMPWNKRFKVDSFSGLYEGGSIDGTKEKDELQTDNSVHYSCCSQHFSDLFFCGAEKK